MESPQGFCQATSLVCMVTVFRPNGRSISCLQSGCWRTGELPAFSLCGKKYVNIPSEKYIYVHIYVCICVYTYLCKMDECRYFAGLS